MNTLKDYISEYLNYCEYRKQLNFKTIKAYKIDLNQYNSFCLDISDPFSKKAVDSYITELFKHYKSKSVKRKIASLKAFFHYLEYTEFLAQIPLTNWMYIFAKPSFFPRLSHFILFRSSYPYSTRRKRRPSLPISSNAVCVTLP